MYFLCLFSSRCKMSLRFAHTLARVCSSSLCRVASHHLTLPQCVYPVVSWRTLGLSSLVSYGKAAINTLVHVFWWAFVLISVGQIVKNGIVESKNRYTYHFIKKKLPVFQNDYMMFRSHQQCMRVLAAPHSVHVWCLPSFLISAIAVGVSSISLWF